MKKTNLRDMKQNNRKLIIQALIDHGNMARVELAQLTGLSPSTVTSLVTEFLEDGVLIETGSEVSTGGRRRKELSINPDYGVIAVVSASRVAASIHFFDMGMNKLGKKELAKWRASGNQILEKAEAAIDVFFRERNISLQCLGGIGLLFLEDTQKDDFSVVFSTSLSSDVITLAEAFYSRFQVPVMEEYSMVYSITEALAKVPYKVAKNSAYISLADSMLIRIIIDGKPLPMRDGDSADIGDFVQGLEVMVPKGKKHTGLVGKVAALIALYCAMFPLEEIFIVGESSNLHDFLQALNKVLKKMMSAPPPIRSATLERKEFTGHVAERIRKKVLLMGSEVYQ